MENLTIANFRFGLDKRRSELTNVLGTLEVCNNAHINQGGEVEKRKAFIRALLPGNTYGLEGTSSGVETYGSRPASVASVSRTRAANVTTIVVAANHGFIAGDRVTITGLGGVGFNVTNTALTATGATSISYANTGANVGVTADVGGTITLVMPLIGAFQTVYVRLQHPAILDGATFNAAKHLMTSVPWSYTFEGKGFVCTQYADGNRFLYFDGTLVEQSRRGLVLNGLITNPNLAQQLADTLDGVEGFHTEVSGSSVSIWSDLGVDYVPTVDEHQSAIGTISMIQVSSSTEGVNGVGAVGRFQILAFSTLGSVSSVKVNSVELLGNSVALTGLTTISAVATAIANEINESASDPRYTAQTSLGTVFIYASVNEGDTPNTFVVETTGDRIAIGNGSFALPVSPDGTTCTSILATATEILGAVIARLGSETNWATAIAAQIVTFNTVYTAASSGGTVYVSKKNTKSNDADVVLTITLSAGVITEVPPNAPTQMLVESSQTVILSWDAVSGATDYHVWRSTNFGGPYDAAISTAGSNSYTDTNVSITNSTRYYYYVTAVNGAGESAPSATVSAIVALQTDALLDAFAIRSGTSKISFDYNDAITPYSVYRGTVPGVYPTHIVTLNAATAGTYYDDTNVIAGVIYYYKVLTGFGAAITTAQEDYHSNELGSMTDNAFTVNPFQVKLQAPLISGTSGSKNTDVIVNSTNPGKAIPSGGSSPYTFSWIEVNNPNGMLIKQPNSNSTGFSVSVPKGKTYFGVFRCLVTDKNGKTAISPDLTVQLSHT